MKVSDGYGGCKCPTDYESDGTWGGCKLIDPCMNVDCPDAKRCEDGECVNCSAGSDCGCYDDDATANGDGVCEPNIHECDPGKEYNTDTRSCENCAEKEDCGCFDQGGYADGNGGCKIVCEDWEYWRDGSCHLQAGRCNTSSDCLSGNRCSSHSCVPGCDSDDQCGYGESCVSGLCQTACSNSPCTNPKYPTCSPYGQDYLCECTSSSCPSGYYCKGWTVGGGYTTGSPDSGLCKPNRCQTNNDCPKYGQTCNTSTGTCEFRCDGVNPCTNSKYPTCDNFGTGGYLCRCTSSSCPSGYYCKTETLGGGYSANSTDSGLCKPIVCKTNTDCPEYGQTCVSGVCKRDACASNPCTNPKYPNCHEYGYDSYYCTCTSSSCGSGYKCESDTIEGTPDPGLCKVITTEQCSTDEDCSAEKRCVAGYCIFRATCSKDSDCASTERCNENGYCVLK